MCLIAENKEGLISNCDIICYKILIPIGEELHTPYRDFVFPINKVVTDEEEESIIPIFNTDKFGINGGFFHSHKYLSGAMLEQNILSKCSDIETEIYNAIIPANTLFYKGIDGDLCSKSLKIIGKFYHD